MREREVREVGEKEREGEGGREYKSYSIKFV